MLNAISIPLDLCLYDEVDDLDSNNLMWSRQRLDASQFGREVGFACGRHPGEGIDARFQRGTQHHWHLKYPSCGKDDQIPELLFPNNLANTNHSWHIVCVKCRTALDVQTTGRWIAHYSGRSSASFRLSALSVPALSLTHIMEEWKQVQENSRLLAPFRCSKLALADASDRQLLTAGDLTKCAILNNTSLTGFGCTYIGIDVGDTCHVACMTIDATDKINYVRFAAITGENLLSYLQHVANYAYIAGVLIDERPEGSLARNVCGAFRDCSYLQEFGRIESNRSKAIADEHFRIMVFNREETLAEWCDLLLKEPRSVLFPEQIPYSGNKGDVVHFSDSIVARHILNGAQRTESRDTRGFTELRFRSGQLENHYLMAAVFAWRIARCLHGRSVLSDDINVIGDRSTHDLA